MLSLHVEDFRDPKLSQYLIFLILVVKDLNKYFEKSQLLIFIKNFIRT